MITTTMTNCKNTKTKAKTYMIITVIHNDSKNNNDHVDNN